MSADKSIAQRYARALFDTAEQKGNADTVSLELQEILRLFDNEPDFFRLFQNPRITAYEKYALLDKIFINRVSPLIKDFLRILIDKKRIEYIKDIAEGYNKICLNSQNTKDVTVLTAIGLDKDTHNRLKDALERLMQAQVLLTTKTDPCILGGIVVYVDGKMIDASVRNRLSRLKEKLRTVKVV